MVVHKNLVYQSTAYNQFILITSDVEKLVEESGVQEGMVYVMTKHTTTGICVNEALECLESDISVLLGKLAPEDGMYSHARILDSYGATAGNPTGHLKSHLTNYFAIFPVSKGKIVRGSAQDIYFAEFDGPQRRTVMVTIMGE